MSLFNFFSFQCDRDDLNARSVNLFSFCNSGISAEIKSLIFYALASKQFRDRLFNYTNFGSLNIIIIIFRGCACYSTCVMNEVEGRYILKIRACLLVGSARNASFKTNNNIHAKSQNTNFIECCANRNEPNSIALNTVVFQKYFFLSSETGTFRFIHLEM